jgi:hypothetical protein
MDVLEHCSPYYHHVYFIKNKKKMIDGTLWHILNGIIAIMEKLSGEVIFSLRFFSQDISVLL